MALVKYNNNSISDVTELAGVPTGSLTHIKTLTASSSSTLSFVDGSSDVVLDNTYPIYKFEFINIHPATDQASFQVNFRDGDSSYDATKTTSNFRAYHNEAGNDTSLGYFASEDLAQSTAVQIIGRTVGNDNDQSCTGEIFLFSPSSTTFVKHFLIRSSVTEHGNYYVDYHIAGYCNVTAAIDGVQFSFSTGNIDSGTIKLYGIKDS
jgi:hypothetical protein